MSTLIAGGIAVAVAVLGILWRLLSNASKAGYNKKEAEDAKARNENLDRIQAAKEAGRAARDGAADGVPDPFDRDNKR